MVLILIAVSIGLTMGFLELRKHQQNIDAIPIRINVNGIRGKSTVTRLIYAILKEANYKVVGKSTGTDARTFYWFTDQEKTIKRPRLGPNISEQKLIVKETVEYKGDALVSECMAVRPQYQIVFQEKLMQANIGVITNVLEDHLEEMGPTLDEIADAFTATIPYNGHCIVSPNEYTGKFKEIAEERDTELIEVDLNKIEESYLRKFSYIVFPENVALALGVAKALEIDKKVALRGMLKATPDSGALTVKSLGDKESPSYFFNGFSGNDPQSTLNIWNRIKQLGYREEDPIIIMNCRRDRIERTREFTNKVLPYLPDHTLVVIGQSTQTITDAVKDGKITPNNYINLDREPTDRIVNEIKQLLYPNRVIFGIGNIHGAAKPLTKALQQELGVE